jgi:hypothetical protein
LLERKIELRIVERDGGTLPRRRLLHRFGFALTAQE